MKRVRNSEKFEKYKKMGAFINNIDNHHLPVNKEKMMEAKYYMVLAVRSGRVLAQVDGRNIRLKVNNAILVRRGREVSLLALGGEECWVTEVSFGGSGVQGILEYLDFGELMEFDIAGNPVGAALDGLIQDFDVQHYFRASITLQTMLLEIRDIARGHHRISDLNEIYQYIQEHYSEPLDLNHLAEIYGTSVSYFSRAFKQYFDIAPMAFVNQIRMHYARIMLSSTDMRIRDVAENCGFDKMEYFCYVFKKSEGITPSQYRANRRRMD